MTAEAASALGVDVVVLAEQADDAATAPATRTLIGSPGVPGDLSRLAEVCDAVTFDHEQVDLDEVGELIRAGRVVRPGSGTLEVAVDKARMRDRFDSIGIPVPRYEILDTSAARPSVSRAVAAFAGSRGYPVVLKATRGGYDGKGVWLVDDQAEADQVCDRAAAGHVPLMVEEMVPITCELAVLVARRPGGETVVWPAVETTQVGGVCREVLAPGRLDRATAAEAVAIARKAAEEIGLAGVMAVELFLTAGDLVVNEIAARPHNSGHWTIEGSTTSQFENHVRAVLDLPLGDPGMTAPFVANVNVFGPDDGSDPADRLGDALAMAGVHVHLYGKKARPRRKLGHVTVCGSDLDDVRARAWAAARVLGTPALPGIPAVDMPAITSERVQGAPR
jgi:5-(carboxyamino)imidazole ribonucleotide synthase